MPFFSDGGRPADDVPQYWHRADGFEDIFIAHAESRHRVRFAREHLAAAFALAHISSADNKNSICVFIFSLGVNYIKILSAAQRKIKKCLFSIDKIHLFVYIIVKQNKKRIKNGTF